MDRIILTAVDFYAHGGVLDSERAIGQRYRAHVELELDLHAAGRSDDVSDTVHYGMVHDALVEEARSSEFNLIEALAERIARRLLADFRVDTVTLELHKLLPPIDGVVAAAGVRIVRHSSRSLAAPE